MSEKISVAEAKRNFSELMAKVVYQGREYVIERRGRPMVAIINADNLKSIHRDEKKFQKGGLFNIVGRFSEQQNFVKEVEHIYQARLKMRDRKVEKY